MGVYEIIPKMGHGLLVFTIWFTTIIISRQPLTLFRRIQWTSSTKIFEPGSPWTAENCTPTIYAPAAKANGAPNKLG